MTDLNNDTHKGSSLLYLRDDKLKETLNNFFLVYKNFENQFVHVYPDFHKSLLSLHPLLSTTDLRLCSYIRMNQSSNEIAQLTGVSIRTVESQRYRLRKKIGIGKEGDLNGYLILI